MSKFDKPIGRSAAVEVVRPLGRCGVTGCSDETSIAFARAVSPSGASVVVPCGVAIDHGWTLRYGWQVHGYVERCALHYSLEQLAEDRIRWRNTHGDRPYPIPDWRDPPFCYIRSADDFREYTGVGFDKVLARMAQQVAA